MIKNILQIFNFKSVVLILCCGNFYQISGMKAEGEKLYINNGSSNISAGELSDTNFQLFISKFNEIKEHFYLTNSAENKQYLIDSINDKTINIREVDVNENVNEKNKIKDFSTFCTEIESYISNLQKIEEEKKERYDLALSELRNAKEDLEQRYNDALLSWESTREQLDTEIIAQAEADRISLLEQTLQAKNTQYEENLLRAKEEYDIKFRNEQGEFLRIYTERGVELESVQKRIEELEHANPNASQMSFNRNSDKMHEISDFKPSAYKQESLRQYSNIYDDKINKRNRSAIKVDISQFPQQYKYTSMPIQEMSILDTIIETLNFCVLIYNSGYLLYHLSEINIFNSNPVNMDPLILLQILVLASSVIYLSAYIFKTNENLTSRSYRNNNQKFPTKQVYKNSLLAAASLVITFIKYII